MRALGTIYEETRARIMGLVEGIDEDTAARPLPTCPEWSVHDLLAHMAGSCADITTGNVQGAATDPWTAAQVEARRDRSVVDIIREWDEVAPQIAVLIDDFPGRSGAQMVSDVTVHEHDIRGALSRAGARDVPGIRICLDFLITTVMHPGMTALGLGPLELRAGDDSWLAGTDGPPSGDLDTWRACVFEPEKLPLPPSTKVGSVAADEFELFRAVSGRRSATQIRRFDWNVDPEPFIPIFGLGPFTVRPTDLDE